MDVKGNEYRAVHAARAIVLQAIGIVLEGMGLLIAFGGFGSLEKRWLRDFYKHRSSFPMEDDLRDEGFQFSIQILFIGLGLVLQLIGLFVKSARAKTVKK